MFQKVREMKRKIGLTAMALTLTAALAACSSTAENDPDPSAPAVAPTASAHPSPTASPNTVTKGLDRAARDVGDAARGAVNGTGRMIENAGDAIQNSTW